MRRTHSFPHTADIMVNSFHDPADGEVLAFEEQIGSHGGLGGAQGRPFLLSPLVPDRTGGGRGGTRRRRAGPPGPEPLAARVERPSGAAGDQRGTRGLKFGACTDAAPRV
ncbi:hypothetical protein GCM10011428_33110 [Streptomyces violaceus]